MKNRDKDVSILRNISFLIGQTKKENVSFPMGHGEYIFQSPVTSWTTINNQK